MSEKKTKSIAKRVPVLLIAAVLVVGVVAGAGIWLFNVNVPIDYDEPYTIEMSESEIGDYNWKTLQFKETSTTETAYFNETGSGISYHQYVRIENPTGGSNANVIADIEEPDGFSDQMGFTVLDGIVEPGEAGKVEVEAWGNISTGDIAVAAGETKKMTVIYTLSNEVPSSNGYSVSWNFYEGESITVNQTAGEGDYNTIQSAIDNATGTAIFVEPGTYNENLTVDVPGLVLTSTDGPGGTIINAQGANKAIDITSNLGDVTVEGFTVRNWTVGGIGQGMSDRKGTSAHIKNNIVEVPDGGPDAHGNSIQVTGNGSSVIGNEVEITGFSFEEEKWSTTGILVYSASDTVIRNNHVKYVDEGVSKYYNGIAIGGGSRGTPASVNVVVESNTIEDTSYGLAVYDGNEITKLEDNTFTDNDFQVYDGTERMDLNKVLSDNSFNPSATVVDNTVVDDPGSNTALNLNTDYSGSSIQDVIGHTDTAENHTIIVGPGTYSENLTVDVANLTLKSSVDHDAVIEGTVNIGGRDVSFEGFTVSPTTTFTDDTPPAAGIFTDMSGVNIEDNIIEGIRGDASVDTDNSMSIHGIQVFGYGDQKVKDIVISNNLIRDIRNEGDSSTWPLHGGASGIKIQNNIDGVTIENNTIKDIHSAGWVYGIVSTPSSKDTTQPKNLVIKRNHIQGLNDGTVYDVFSDETAAPYPGAAFCLDTTSGDPESGTLVDASQVELHYNNFETPVGVQNKDEDHTLNATNNWWGTNTESEIQDKIIGDVDYNPWEDSELADAGTNW